MDRLTFLRSMLGSSALLTLPPLHLLEAEEQDRLAWTKDCHQLFLYDCYVRGVQYHAGGALIGQLKEEDELDLVREYGNEHDPDAVAVHWQGHKMGYLPMGENRALANLIDQGMLLAAHVVYTQPDERPWEQCFVCVELLIPRHPSFDAYLDHYMDRPDAGYRQHQHFGGLLPGGEQVDI